MSLFSFPTIHTELFEPFDALTSPFFHIVSDSDDEDDYDLLGLQDQQHQKQVPSKRPQRAIAHSKSKSKPTTELSLTSPSLPSTLTSFTPRFDVREKDDAYYLDGEMPGVEQKDVDIEFVDEQTLQIKGSTNRVYEDTNMKEGENENENENESEAEMTDGESDASSAASSSRSRESSPYQATVEDVDEDGNPKQTEKSEQPSSPTKAVTKKPEAKEVTKTKNEKPQWKYWVSERSMGSFQRTFRFTEKVDQENVRASLRNGVLSVVVPKEVKNVKRRKITIE